MSIPSQYAMRLPPPKMSDPPADLSSNVGSGDIASKVGIGRLRLLHQRLSATQVSFGSTAGAACGVVRGVGEATGSGVGATSGAGAGIRADAASSASQSTARGSCGRGWEAQPANTRNNSALNGFNTCTF